MDLKTMGLPWSRGENQEVQDGLALAPSLVFIAELVLTGRLLRDGL